MSGDLVPHFPNHIRNTARALSLAGYSSQAIERQLRDLYPGDDPPSAPTIRRWRSTQSELSTEESEAISQANREIALTAQRIQLERMTERPDDIKFQELVIAAGVAQSKEHERIQRNTPQSDNRQLVIVVNNPMSNEPTILPPT